MHTLRFLKPIQLYYQVLYRAKSFVLPYIPYNRYRGAEIHKLKGEFGCLVPSAGKLSGSSDFTFLHLSKNFVNEVDWNFSGHGKLWNYNLQYFDYLHDPHVTDDVKQRLIEDFAMKLAGHSIGLEPYPVSLRIINWILYYSKSGYSSPGFLHALQYQVDYLQHNLEHHILANHLMENLISLVVASVSLRDEVLFADASNRLIKQLEEQILPDGGHYEGSPMYHCILLSKLLLLYGVLSSNKPAPIQGTLRAKIERMLGWLQAFAYRNGSYAHVNDSTNDIAPDPSVLFNFAGEMDLVIPPARLQQSGYRKFCQKDYEVMVDVAPIRPVYQPGHAHADMLHFCVQYKGAPLLVDTGTGTYDASSRRSFERSTAAHNTVTIGTKSQAQVWSSFRVGRRSHVHIAGESDKHLLADCMWYDNSRHTRRFDFLENRIIITDVIDAGVREGCAAFHLDHSIKKIILKKNKVFVGGDIVFIFEVPTDILLLKYQQAVGFNKYAQSSVIKINFHSHHRTEIAFC